VFIRSGAAPPAATSTASIETVPIGAFLQIMDLMASRPMVLLLAALASTMACSRSQDDVPEMVGRRAEPAARSAPAPSTAPRAAARPRVVVLGDSLSSGLGIDPNQAYPALLQQKIDAHGFNYEVVNAGVSGDTTADGLSRFDWAVEGDVKVLVLELGGNDGLRGLSVEQMTGNLSKIIERAQARHITVLLCGMEAPPNFGSSYTTAFRAAYRALAEKHHVTLLPFLLDGVAGAETLNQADGIHPNVQGAQRVAETVWGSLRPLLGDRTSAS
jgi:acyl-CoA thioesterase-1